MPGSEAAKRIAQEAAEALGSAALKSSCTFFGGTAKGATSFQISEFYMLILGFIPRNIFEPFISGNTQQIIILAIAGGIILLYLGDRASHLLTFSEQATVAFQTIMVFASALIPVMVFLSIVDVILEGGSSEIAKIYKILIKMII